MRKGMNDNDVLVIPYLFNKDLEIIADFGFAQISYGFDPNQIPSSIHEKFNINVIFIEILDSSFYLETSNKYLLRIIRILKLFRKTKVGLCNLIRFNFLCIFF